MKGMGMRVGPGGERDKQSARRRAGQAERPEASGKTERENRALRQGRKALRGTGAGP